jgi:RNA polymerase sigma-70 factor (ECF subfamily)
MSLTTARADTPGFEELALPLFPSLYNFAHWLTRDRDEAEDLVQETFAKALRGFASFQPDTSFKSWIFRILKNTFLTSRTGLRVQRTVPLVEDAEVGSAAETPETILLAHASRELVRGAIEALAPSYREVVVLRDVDGFTYQEIADALSIPIGTVMSRLSRGRRDIRRHVEAKLGGK